jgi:hypothetical protein
VQRTEGTGRRRQEAISNGRCEPWERGEKPRTYYCVSDSFTNFGTIIRHVRDLEITHTSSKPGKAPMVTTLCIISGIASVVFHMPKALSLIICPTICTLGIIPVSSSACRLQAWSGHIPCSVHVPIWEGILCNHSWQWQSRYCGDR